MTIWKIAKGHATSQSIQNVVVESQQELLGSHAEGKGHVQDGKPWTELVSRRTVELGLIRI